MSLVSLPLALTDAEREELRLMSISKALGPEDVFRANLILMLAEGRSYNDIQVALRTTAPTIARWKKRFLERRIESLANVRSPSPRATVMTTKLKELVIAATCRRPSDGSSRWSCRALAKELGLSKDLIQRIWRSEGLRPHRLERFMLEEDQPADNAGADIVGLYLKPGQHAAVFCNTKILTVRSAISSGTGVADDGSAPWPANAPHGQSSLYRILSKASGQLKSGRTSRVGKEECVAFLSRIGVGEVNSRYTVILDRISREEAPRMELFLKEHPGMTVQLVMSRSAWLERVERWCLSAAQTSSKGAAEPGRTSLARQLMWHIRAHARSRKALQWVFSDSSGLH